MRKYGSYLLYGVALVFAIGLVYASFNTNKSASEQKSSKKTAQVQNSKPAEKIQVFLFHATQRCSSCIAIGKFAKETVEQKFSEEIKSGKIEFREINIDLPENKEVATKFKAAGSSLFINPIVDGKDNIKEDTQVWRLVSNEQGFISYLSDKIKTLL